MEMIIRKSFKETLNEYLEHTSIGGIKQIRDHSNTKFQRFCWLGLFCFALCTVCVFLYTTWVTTFSSPLIITSESITYPIKDIDFPAIALCNFNRISRKALVALAASSHKKHPKLVKTHNFTVFDLENFYKHFAKLINFNYNDSINSIIDKLPAEYNVNKIMAKLAPKCEEMLIKCQWAGKEVSCMQIFDTRRTAMGHCCAFNYVLAVNSADRPNPVKLIAPVKRQEVPGSSNGLTVIADPLIDDYAYRFVNRDGFRIYLYDPQQFPDISGSRVLYRIAQPNKGEVLQIKSVKQYATSEVLKYPVKTRKCLFRHELKSKFYNTYSYSVCLVRCRMATIRSLCKCIPYFYPTNMFKNTKTCTLSHLRCLNKHKEKLLYIYPKDVKNKLGLELELANSIYCPDCLPDCELTHHFAKGFKVSLAQASRKGLGSNFLVGLNLSNKCAVTVYRPTAVGKLHRLDVVAYWFEILSNIGGFAGMVMGIGCFTVVEILYYIIIRFMQIVYINYKKYR